MERKGSKSSYLYSYVLTLACFGAANITDQFMGHSEYSKTYPFLLFLAWTGVVATFLYMGWKLVYWLNAIPLYGLMIYSIWNHSPDPNGGLLQWLIGTLPLPLDYMIFIPAFFLVSMLLQFILYRVSRAVEDRTYRELEEDDDQYNDEGFEEEFELR